MSAGQGDVIFDSLFMSYDNAGRDRGELHSVGLSTGFGADGLWQVDTRDSEHNLALTRTKTN